LWQKMLSTFMQQACWSSKSLAASVNEPALPGERNLAHQNKRKWKVLEVPS